MGVEAAMEVTLGHDTVLHTTHHVLHILRNLTTQHMSAQRVSGYKVLLTSTQNLSIKYTCPTSGPVAILNDMLGLKSETDIPPEEHNCIQVVHEDTAPRADMMQDPQPGFVDIFVDGFCSSYYTKPKT